MDILQDDASNASVDLSELVDTQPTTTTAPVGAVRNRAATSAILSGDPTQMIDKYRLLMQEGSEGESVTHDEVMQSMDQQNKTKSMGIVMNVLGDKSIPLDQKKRLMNFVQTSGFREEPTITMQTKALEQPSDGEDVKGEAARISLSATMGAIHKEASDRQRMLNGFLATIPTDSVPGLVGDMAAAEVLPFGRNVIGAKVAAKVDELDGKTSSLGAWVKNFLLPGSTRQDLQDKLMSIPPERRGEMTAKLLQATKESAAVFHSDNYYSQFDVATRLLEEGSHSNGEVWTENMSTVLDAFWVGSEIRAAKAGLTSATKAAEAASGARRPGSANPGVSDAENVVHKADWEVVPDPFNPMAARIGKPKAQLGYDKQADVAKRIELNAVVRQENPVSPFNVIEQANPASARAMHEAIVAGDDELAEAITGVSREQAIANNIYPQVGTESGGVLNKVDQTLKDSISNTGATRYTPDELNGAVDTIKNDFRNASGLQINDAMTTFRVDGDHIVIDGHYSTPGGAFLTADAARSQAQFALRDYGIADNEIVIMKRDGMDYVPVTGNDGGSDFIVKVQTRQPIGDESVQNWNPLDVKRNFTDRITQTASEDKGSMSGWIMDPGAMLHPTLTGSASIASDQAVVIENMLLKPIREFRDSVNKFSKERRVAVDDYLKEANANGIKQDRFDLIARGFNDKEIEALGKWKDIWDNHYYLENYDMVRTLNSQGYQLFENANTKLFGKPVVKNQNISSLYDPQSNTVRSLSKVEMDSLYNQGGSYVALRRPVNIGGQDVEHMIVRNTPGEYMRKVRDTDSVLNYRDGYYQLNYNKGAKFVDELTVVSGKEVRRTIAVAGNTRDAETFRSAQEASTGNRHVIREDARGFEKDGDGYWDVNSASGRISQRLRGKPLQTAQGVNQLGAGVYVDNPLESASRAARSVAGRTVTRPVLETAKQRFMKQYEEFLPSDGMGGKRYPNHLSEIVDHRSHVSSAVADARTTYGYINYLQSGYINTADQLFKGGMNVLAEMLNKFPLAENAAQALSQVSITNRLKKTVFQAYIVGSMPFRQWIVQAHQATRMMAYNPVGVLNGGMEARMAGYLGVKGGVNVGNKAIQSFVKFVDDSGMVAGVDKNSLVRGLGMSMADSSSAIKRGLGTAASIPQTLGFDIGEKVNQLGHLAAVHEKWTRQGVNLADKTQRDLALTEARALSYDLNKAGDLAYTQSTPAAVLQFLQMPHKAMLQLANRKLPLAVRLRLQAWDLVMFGTGAGVLGEGIRRTLMTFGHDGEDILPNDPELRDAILNGLEQLYLNKAITALDDSGEQSRIDFSALAPNDMDGWARMYHAFMDQGAMAALAQSPSGQLFAVDGVNGSKRDGRIPHAIITMARYFNIKEELDPNNPTEFSSVLRDVAKISSGWTAAENARMALAVRKKFDAQGGVIDQSITVPEAWAAGLGFGTMATKELYKVSNNLSEDKKAREERVMSRYRDIMNYYRSELGKPENDVAYIQKVTSMLMRSFTGAGELELVTKQWQKDMVGKEQSLLKQMIQASGISDSRHLEDNIKMAPISEDKKQMLLQRFKDVRAIDARNKGK